VKYKVTLKRLNHVKAHYCRPERRLAHVTNIRWEIQLTKAVDYLFIKNNYSLFNENENISVSLKNVMETM